LQNQSVRRARISAGLLSVYLLFLLHCTLLTPTTTHPHTHNLNLITDTGQQSNRL